MGKSTEVQPFNMANLPADIAALFDVGSLEGDLTTGVEGGFGVVSTRGSKWRIKFGGEETPVVNDDGDPIPGLEVVLLKASKNVSKIYYAKKYSEGDVEDPDCFSLDGIKPAAGAKAKQSSGCAACPHNQWGSRITENGKKAKACSDNRRMAVVPAGDIANKQYGGPMLLRVPPASLQDLASFGTKMQQKGFPYNAIVTRIGFDVDASFPKLTFKAVRPLSSKELMQVAEHLRGDVVDRIFEQAAEVGDAQPAAKVEKPAPKKSAPVDTEFETTPGSDDDEQTDMFESEKPASKATGKVTKKKTSSKKAALAASDDDEGSSTGGELDDELDELLKGLDDLS